MLNDQVLQFLQRHIQPCPRADAALPLLPALVVGQVRVPDPVSG